MLPDMVNAHLGVLNSDPTITTVGILGLLRALDLDADGYLCECLYVVEVLQPYPFIKRERSSGGHHCHKHWPVILMPGGGGQGMEFHEVWKEV